MSTNPTTPLGDRVDRNFRWGIGRVEVVILLAGLAVIGAFLVSTSTLTRRLDALKVQVQANHALQVKVSVSNLRLEQALSGQAQVLKGTSAGGPFPDQQGPRQPGAVDVDDEINGNLADAIRLCHARLDGGPSPIGEVPAASGAQVRANLAALCQDLATLRDLTNVRLAEGSVSRASPDVVQQYEQRFREVLRLAEEDSRALDDVGVRDDVIRRRTTELTTAALLSLFVGLTVVVRRTRRAITKKNVELAQLASIVEGANDAVVSFDLDGTILSWNRGAEQLYGFSSEEAVGHSLLQVIPDHRRHEERETLREVARGATYDGYDTTNLRKDGTPVDVSMTISPLRDVSGRVVGAAVIGRDVSSRKRAERAQAEARDAAIAASRLKSEFLANMSHEIRTPINGVIGLVDLLLDTELDGRQRRYVQGAREAAGTLLGIINDILDFSKIEAGRVEIEETDVDLQVLVEAVADLLAIQAHSKGLELACLYDRDVPVAVRGDPVRLRQVLVNLLSNAVKFTAEGEVVLRVEKVDEDDESVIVRFEVSDTGIGIAGDHVRLFDAFSQEDASTTRRFGGTGLGLALSKQLVELMGGEIGVQSEVGRGSTFWFTVRLVKQPAQSRDLEAVRHLDGVRVLVVDDNATQRLVLDERLSRWGMRPLLAEDGFQALGLVAAVEEPFQLAIVDLQMPEMDGLELARELRMDERHENVVMILLASTGQVDAAAAREVGIDVTLTKPVRQSDLHDAIVDLLTPGRPTARDSAATCAPASLPAQTSAAELDPVLVVEDNALNQMVAADLLSALGYRAEVVGDGLEALEALERREYAVVLMDCHMPEMDGYRATAEIRRKEAGGRHVPIIAMTANAMAGDRDACLAAGMDDYITKPIDRSTLAAVLARWLGRAHQEAHVSEAPVAAPTAHRRESPPATAILDPAPCEQIVESLGAKGPAALGQLIRVFLEDAPVLLEKLRDVSNAGDAREATRLAHTLKSNGATLGATAFASLCQEAESMSAAGNTQSFPSLIAALEAELEAVTGALRSLQSNLSTALSGVPSQPTG